MPVPQRIEDHYDVPPEEYWLGGPAISSTPEYFAGAIDRFRELWTGDGPTDALDVGAGTGRAMVSLASAGFRTRGLEPSPSFWRAAIEQGLSEDRLSCTTLEDARFEPESFDLVSFGAVLEHLTEPSSAIERVFPWLKPGGLIYIEVPSSDWLMARLLDAAYRAQGLDYTCHLSPMHAPYHLFEFTLDAFKAHSSRVGYDIAFSQHHVGARTYAPRRLDQLVRPLMKKTRTGMQLEVWLEKA